MFFIGQRYTYSIKCIKISSYYILVNQWCAPESESGVEGDEKTEKAEKSRVKFGRRNRKDGDPGDGVGS